MIGKRSLWVIKRAVPASKNLNTGQHPDSVNGCTGCVAVLGSGGRTGAMEGMYRVTEAHAPEEKGQRACADITVMVNSKDNRVAHVNALLDVLRNVSVKEGERIWPG